MNIKKESIINISSDFTNIENMLCGLNYIVCVTVYKFKISEKLNSQFSLNHMNQIFYEEEKIVEGSIKFIEWEDVYENINRFLRYTGEDQGKSRSEEHTSELQSH